MDVALTNACNPPRLLINQPCPNAPAHKQADDKSIIEDPYNTSQMMRRV